MMKDTSQNSSNPWFTLIYFSSLFKKLFK
jgi:hypothetical protein